MTTSRSLLSLRKLDDFRTFCKECGWNEETPVGDYEILRMRRKGNALPLIVYKKAEATEHATVFGISYVMACKFARKECGLG